ncbi:basic amino acid ABC transporter substrate-binding protein [Cellulomonas soli]|uniref:Basic amino acid ABC transporter substrate-binding protein n=2 Tax=Cellulomonas soli TaxID=931535 RepID=A0A512PB64_9CELL|nr:basic amino acid ABC transporter substrate-binding protein [Cellulomonas soli]
MRSPRFLAAASLAAGAALLLSACASSDDSGSAGSDATAAGGVTLLTPGTLTVCSNPPYEPFEFKDDNGDVVGLDIDIMQEVADDLGVDLLVKVTAFETIQSGVDLDTGSCDVVASGITITDERKAKFDFSEPYFDADQGLLVPAGSDLSDVASLEGKKIAVQQATTGETFAQDNDLQTVQFEDLGLQIQALKTGQVDAAINDIAVLGPFVEEGFEVATTFPTGEQYGFGVKKGSTALLDAINGTLDRIRTDGTYDAIYTERIGTAPAGE